LKIITKKKATEFFKSFVGTAKGLHYEDGTWKLETGGQMRYEAWAHDELICVHCILGGYCISGLFFNFESYEYADEYMDACRRQELYDTVIESAEYWQAQIKKYLGN
jgi:hypothetical protein